MPEASSTPMFSLKVTVAKPVVVGTFILPVVGLYVLTNGETVSRMSVIVSVALFPALSSTASCAVYVPSVSASIVVVNAAGVPNVIDPTPGVSFVHA